MENLVIKMKKNKLLFAVLLSYMILGIYSSEMVKSAFGNSMYYLKEMFEVLPVIFLLTVSIDVLVSKDWIIGNLGEGSGIKGGLLALIFGSISAGPIYAAFPICKTLIKKGAGVGNIVVILSAWAVVKLPMLANEAKFLGLQFMAMRWILTVTAIFIMAYVISKFVKTNDIPNESEKQDGLVLKVDYCVGCGICGRILPEVFIVNKGKVVLNLEHVKGVEESVICEIVDKCPVGAIEYNR